MPSGILAGVCILLSAGFGYLTYDLGEQYAPGLIVFLLLAVLCYVYGPQINWWWWTRHPPDLPKSLHPPLENTPFYQRLTEEGQRLFRKRVFLFNQAQRWMPQAMDKITEDIKTAISAGAVQVNFHRLNFLYPDYENIVVYAHPFPSPQYPNHMHASEVFEDEHGNGLIFSVEHVMRSFIEPQLYYNVSIHEYADLLIRTSNINFPAVSNDIWPALEQISGFSHERLLEFIGLDELDPLQVSITHYLVFLERFRMILPDLAAELDEIFLPKTLHN
jgi:hypothetical protein